MSNNQRIKAILTGVFVVLSLVVASCGPLAARVDTGEGEAVVGVRHGMELSLDAVPPTGVPVLCHGQAPAGVASIELYVNGMFIGRASNTAGPGTHEFNYFTAEMSFEPDGPGAYELRCRTQDHEGRSFNSVDVTIFLIGEAVPSPPPEVPTATPTETEVPPEVPTATSTSTAVPTDTPTATGVPTDTPTSTPTSTLTPTPVRVKILWFEADRTQIVVGECVRFTWQVEAPTEIYFDGVGVTNYPAYEDRCPTSTRSFELRAEGYGGPDIESITILVTPGDTDGPSIYRETGPKVMAAPMGGYCRDPHEFGAMVVDPSGVRWVKLICSFNQGPDQSCGGLQHLGSNFYQIEYRLPTDGSVQSGDTMHWHIRACDMVDPMNCTNSPSHDIPIGPCVI